MCCLIATVCMPPDEIVLLKPLISQNNIPRSHGGSWNEAWPQAAAI
jgi:hypothetical protein